jgi:hypothetical protein
MTVRCDPDADCFRMSSPVVRGSDEPVTVLIDSRVPFPSLVRTEDVLLRRMWRRGLLRPFRRTSGGRPEQDLGGIDVEPDRFRVIDRDGAVNCRIFAIGLPTESPRWFTQVGSATPGSVSRFTLDAKAVGAGVIEALTDAESVVRPELEAVR